MSRVIGGREVGILVAACAVLLGLLPAQWWHAQSDVSGCKTNLKNICTAVEMYSTDNHGEFPTTLSALTPRYLHVLPSCPAAERDTYSAGYQRGPWRSEDVSIQIDGYRVVCRDRNHVVAGMAENEPQLNADRGHH